MEKDNLDLGTETTQETVEDKETTQEEVDKVIEEGEEFTDTLDSEESKELESKTTKKQSKEINNKYAELRREKEKKEAELKEIEKKAYEKGLVEAVNGVNPYTNEKIEDSHDIQVFLTMREMEKKGLDPITDYYKYTRDKLREETQKDTPKQKDTKWFEEDAKRFSEEYPDVSIAELGKDVRFLKFGKGKINNLPLAEVYADYLEFVGEIESEIDKKARRMVAKSKATPGPVSTTTNVDNEIYSLDQIKGMSQKEVSKNFDKVLKSMKIHMSKR